MTRERSLTSGVRGTRRLRRRDRYALIAASLTAVSLTASGCVVVHGEREVLPAATKAEAAKAIEQFTTAYNKADKAYDSSLDAEYTTGALGIIDAARLKAGHVNSPDGNPQHTPLVLSDVKYTIVQKAGWPRWFIADAKGNKGGNARWLMVFTRGEMAEPWQATYLTLVEPGSVPAFQTDADGVAEAVPADTAGLALPPEDLSKDYAAYLQSGKGSFADGAYTNAMRDTRAKNAIKPGLVTQYIDQQLTEGDYAPLAVRTADGGALVFFTTHHYMKQTAAAGATVPTSNRNVQALTTGEVKQSLTMEFVASGVAVDPAKGKVSVLSRLEGLTGAKGE
ncbi:hypothetical protein [Streptomyces sp900129855]|uniref:DUF8094 domain-containing protein n=1 Tax=Streptomyces sp. 900129855 TaxID=3155129 RepID=A0ABV2Z8X8_9ACTN